MSAYAVGSRPRAEGAVRIDVKTEEGEKALFSAHRSELNAVEREKAVHLAVQCGLKTEVAIYLAVRGGLEAEEVRKLLDNAVQCGLEAEEAEKILYLAVRSGLNAEETLSVAIRTGLKTEEEIYACLLEQLLASFNKRKKDTDLKEWIRPSDRSRDAPKFPFFLFKLKASAKKAQVSWWQKKYDLFPPERPGYTYAARIARLVIGPDGFRLEQAGEGGHRGALSYHIDMKYVGWPRPKEGIFKEGSSVPLREVAVIKRLPCGEGISIMSYIRGLGVKLGDILFLLHSRSITVALSFTERDFYVSSKFKEEPLYARADLDFIDITVPVENMIRKLYRMYEVDERKRKKKQEKQDKKKRKEKQDNQETVELLCQQEEQMLQLEEQKRKKLEVLKRRRDEKKKYDALRVEMKKVVTKKKKEVLAKGKCWHEDYDEACFTAPIISLFCEPDWVKPSEELCQIEESCTESLEESTKLIVHT